MANVSLKGVSIQAGITAAFIANNSFKCLPCLRNTSIGSIEMNGELSSAFILHQIEKVFDLDLSSIGC